ncbi:MAG: MFS transporter [Flavobacteriia bacterium]|nr:MFS transporter [Flavobacteriia bacterium]
MTSFNLIIPELNDFLSKLGGENQKGMIFILFTLSSAISRPFSGRLSDHIGRKKVMYLGIIVPIFVSLLYPLSYSVFFFLTLRFFHGFSAGFFPTGSTALITDILPSNKRGVGMGIWGTFTSLGIGVGQGIGSFVNDLVGIDNLFIIASILSIFSMMLIFFVKESLHRREKFNLNHLKVPKNDIIEKPVLPAAIVMFLTAFCSGIIFVITPDMSKFVGIENKGWFFVFYVICTIFVRLFLGSISDKIGRIKTLSIGVFSLIISMVLIAYSTTPLTYTFASIAFGFATGITSPTIFAWTADLSEITRRGIGAGTMFIALELGIMFGAFSTMLTYDNTKETISLSFNIGAISSGIALLYLIWLYQKGKKEIS